MSASADGGRQHQHTEPLLPSERSPAAVRLAASHQNDPATFEEFTTLPADPSRQREQPAFTRTRDERRTRQKNLRSAYRNADFWSLLGWSWLPPLLGQTEPITAPELFGTKEDTVKLTAKFCEQLRISCKEVDPWNENEVDCILFGKFF